MEPTEGKVIRRKQADLIGLFLEKASTYDMSTGDIIEALIGLTSWCIIERSRPGYEDVTEALYFEQLGDAFEKAKEIKRAKS